MDGIRAGRAGAGAQTNRQALELAPAATTASHPEAPVPPCCDGIRSTTKKETCHEVIGTAPSQDARAGHRPGLRRPRSLLDERSRGDTVRIARIDHAA